MILKKSLKVPKSINGAEQQLLESRFQKARHNLSQKQSQEFRNCSFKGDDDEI